MPRRGARREISVTNDGSGVFAVCCVAAAMSDALRVNRSGKRLWPVLTPAATLVIC